MLNFQDALNPTLNFQVVNIAAPATSADVWTSETSECIRKNCCNCAKLDWDAYERSWNFQSLPLLTASSDPTPTLESSYTAWINQNRDTIAEMKRLEEENNRLFIDAYGLAG